MQRYFRCLAVGSFLLASAFRTEEPVEPISLIQLIASPDKFEGKRVSVSGFLEMGDQVRPQAYGNKEPLLYLHREDALHWLGNALWVEPSAEMKRKRRELTGMYVTIIGRFRAGGKGHLYGAAGGITAVESCIVLSDPNRPVSERYTLPAGLKQK